MNKSVLRIILLLILLFGIALAVVYRDVLNPHSLEQWVEQFGVMGPVVFMLIYIAATVFFLPGSVITLVGGAMFGPVWGTLYNLTGATLGAVLAFLIARYLTAEQVERSSAGKLKQLKSGVEKEGWRFVAFVRLVPLIPFNLLNYALGITEIRLVHYSIATGLFMLPGAFAYTYLGYAGREAVAGGEGIIEKALIALALVAMVAFLPRFIGRLKGKPMLSASELRRQLDVGTDLLLLDVRTAEDFVGELGHVAGSTNIPLEELERRKGELKDYLESPIAIICTTNRRSMKAEQILAKNGFSDLQVLEGGMTDWNRHRYPAECQS